MTLAPPEAAAPARARVPRRRTPAIRRHRWFVPLAFVAPALVVQGVFLFLPLINTFVLAFTDASTVGGGTFTGLDNISRLASDGAFWAAVGRTFVYMAVTVPVITVVSVSVAILVNTSVRGAGIVRPILFSPMVMPMAVVAVVFQYVLSSQGLANQILQGLRITAEPVPFLNDSDLALFSLMAVTIWKGCALYTLILLAALQNVSRDLDEAAQLDGASWPRRTFSVTLPQIRGTTTLVSILAAIATLRVFTEPFVITGGGPGKATETIVLYLYQRGISPGTDAGYASAVSLVLFVFVLAVSGISWLISRRNRI
ncbi:carbohydrate ABC transporter permease [Phytoactinopolyspora halotolerans]|uniref:Sugar ABC transporter permease n=1 Tax=Phytoactinopolyspora halotolerans TaxID=1981512 RepID=A0A6L9S603_9ACTN|nr:sugar ABC transporter permease [Phytoactinopolyspora halotolerans]NEE00413.1 sugar ABC transporter permease [Phytoactinopolyspora halotolerans]